MSNGLLVWGNQARLLFPSWYSRCLTSILQVPCWEQEPRSANVEKAPAWEKAMPRRWRRAQGRETTERGHQFMIIIFSQPKGFLCKRELELDPLEHPVYGCIRSRLRNLQWDALMRVPQGFDPDLVKEFYIHLYDRDGHGRIRLRGHYLHSGKNQ